MKRTLIAGAAAFSMLASGYAVAQTVIQIAPEQRTVIKEYVVKEKVKPYAMKERVSVGATLPADVQLIEVPSTWGPSVSKYRYVYSGDRVHFVDPSNRQVIQIIE